MKADDGATVNVCKTFFLASLGRSPKNDGIIHHTLNSNDDAKFIAKEHGLSAKTSNSAKNVDTQEVDAHIRSYNPTVSHFRRPHAPHRLYLASELTIAEMFAQYMETRADNPVSYEFYRKRVSANNISFTKLGCEQCEYCDRFMIQKDPTISQADFDGHKKRYVSARKEYQRDVNRHSGSAETHNTVCVSVDLEKVILLPHIPCYKSAIFTSRLIVFNETFVPLGTSHRPVVACVWHEGVSGRNKEDLVSTYYHFIKQQEDCDSIIIWLDNCSAQNKNWCFMAFLVYIVNSTECPNLNSITMKYFEPGHTFMSADSFHHQVELAMKRMGIINDFFDFLSCVNSARSGNVEVKDMSTSDFFDWKDLKSTTKLKRNTELRFKNMVSIKAERGSYVLYFKTEHGGPFQELDFLQVKYMRGIERPIAHTKPRGVSSAKKEGILSNLLPLMPEDRRPFWRLLEENGNAEDLNLQSLFPDEEI